MISSQISLHINDMDVQRSDTALRSRMVPAKPSTILKPGWYFQAAHGFCSLQGSSPLQ